MRTGHFVLVTIPHLLMACLSRDRNELLGRQCSVRFARAYLAAVTAPVRQHRAGKSS
jgi:hypothetical protein